MGKCENVRKWDGWELLMDVDNVVDDDKEREKGVMMG